MNTAFFFEIKQISDNSIIFDEFKKQEIFFSYFLVEQKYYLFFYREKSIDIDFLYQSVHVLEELDSKKRKIRSLRGFFLYALEIMETGKDVEILKTNLQPDDTEAIRAVELSNTTIAATLKNEAESLLTFQTGDRSTVSKHQEVDAPSASGSHRGELDVSELKHAADSISEPIRQLLRLSEAFESAEQGVVCRCVR